MQDIVQSRHMLSLKDFQYPLPDSAIAQEPVFPRDSSKLLHLMRQSRTLGHHIFRDLPHLLRPTDILVRNTSKTLPARIQARKNTGGVVEVVFLRQTRTREKSEREHWEVLTSPGIKEGTQLSFANTQLQASCVQQAGYTRVLEILNQDLDTTTELLRAGTLPLPPYIHHPLIDSTTYQTVYANQLGSAATPTAGLHFTPELLAHLQGMGVDIVDVTLHVGLGTFLPVKTEDMTQHPMHAEWFEVSQETADKVNTAKQESRRVVAVGTTSVRTLESCAIKSGGQTLLQAKTGETSAYIYPPYTFAITDALITNFHLPATTLLLLVSAFTEEGRTWTRFPDSLLYQAYMEALQSEYRFLSFGDAMFIE